MAVVTEDRIDRYRPRLAVEVGECSTMCTVPRARTSVEARQSAICEVVREQTENCRNAETAIRMATLGLLLTSRHVPTKTIE